MPQEPELLIIIYTSFWKGFSWMHMIHFNEMFRLTKNDTDTIGCYLKIPHSCKENENTWFKNVKHTIRETSDYWPAACKLDLRVTWLLQSMVTCSLIPWINLISHNNPVYFVQVSEAVKARVNPGVCVCVCVLGAHLDISSGCRRGVALAKWRTSRTAKRKYGAKGASPQADGAPACQVGMCVKEELELVRWRFLSLWKYML